MKKTALVLALVGLLAATGLVQAQGTTTTRTRTALTSTGQTETTPANTTTTVLTNPVTPTPTPTPVPSPVGTAAATTKGGMPVSGNTSLTIAMLLVGVMVLATGAYSFGKTR